MQIREDIWEDINKLRNTMEGIAIGNVVIGMIGTYISWKTSKWLILPFGIWMIMGFIIITSKNKWYKKTYKTEQQTKEEEEISKKLKEALEEKKEVKEND